MRRFTRGALCLGILLLTLMMFSFVGTTRKVMAEETTDELEAEALSGSLTETIVWAVEEDGTLRISGTGAIPGLENPDDAPWANRRPLLSAIVIEEGITEIGRNAFDGCSAAERIIVPNSVKAIGFGAFHGCSAVTSVQLPFVGESREAEGMYGLFGTIFGYPKSGEKSVRQWFDLSRTSSYAIPEGLIVVEITDAERIPFGAFSGIRSLQSVVVNNEIGSVEGRAFYECSSLCSLVLPEGMTHIEEETFAGCSSLNELEIPDAVTKIDYAAFASSGIRSIFLPSSVKEVDRMAFRYCRQLTMVETNSLEAWLSIQFFDDTSNPLSNGVDLVIGGETLTELVLAEEAQEVLPYAFKGCTSLTKLTIRGNIEEIGKEAFEDCSCLEEITLENQVSKFASKAFLGCSSLESVSAASLEEWMSIRFEDDTANPLYNAHHLILSGETLTDLVIPENVEDVNPRSFAGCSIQTVVFPENLVTIGEGAFKNCADLKTVTIPQNTAYIGNGSFDLCTSLELIELPFLGNKIDDDGALGVIFGGTRFELQDLYDYPRQTIPESLKHVIITKASSLPPMAFMGYSYLETITIKSDLTSVGDDAFSCSAYYYDFSGVSEELRRIDSQLENITFLGHAPEFSPKAFEDQTVTVYYSLDDPSWNMDVRRDYGGRVYWMAHRSDGTNAALTKAITTARTSLYEQIPGDNGGSAVGTVSEGKKLNVYDIRRQGEMTWYMIYSGGRYVWIDGNYVYDMQTPEPAAAAKIGQGTTTKKAVIYAEPNSSSTVLGTIGVGKVRNLYAQNGNWYQIYSNGAYVWVRCDSFDFTSANSNRSYATAVFTERAVTYYGHGYDYEPAATITAGTKVNVYAKWENWYLVYKTGKYLWIDGRYLTDIIDK